jgi:hypothetical protein
MIPPTDPAEPEGVDRDAFRTANLADPELAAAYEVENEAIRLDGETIGAAWALGLIPFMLVLLLLSAALGDWVWDLTLPLFLAGAVAVIFVRMGLFRRMASDLPIHLPGGRVYRGAQKRRLLLVAGAAVAGLWLLHELQPVWHIQRWVAEWTASGTIEGW